MKSCLLTFNFNLLLALALLLTGCETDKAGSGAKGAAAKTKKDKKALSTVAFYLETAGGSKGANAIPIYRENPVYVAVESAPFLDFGSVVEASVVNQLDGFAIQIRFDAHGAFVLDTVTTANRNRRIAIFAKFPEPRWLAAPLSTQRNASGMLTFTPDATREEAERFVLGLKNAIAAMNRL